MAKKIILNSIAFLLALTTWSQLPVSGGGEDPVSWSHSVEQVTDSTYVLHFRADIETDWHLYSQHTAEGGALPIEFEFEGVGKTYELVGPVTESETHTAYNEIFEVVETFFKESAHFTQEIVVSDADLSAVRVNAYYQVCKEVCIPGEHQFVFSLDGSQTQVETGAGEPSHPELSGSLKLDLKNVATLQAAGSQGAAGGENPLWALFGLGFLGGLIALLTPCVFPMIPLTVSFFTKQSANRSRGVANAVFYGSCIVLIYFLLSLPFHLFDSVDSQILNSIATNIWLNLVFFLVFVVFAFSFFGYYELTLPASWANRADAASGRIGGAVGIFLMALTLAIVSFSCTGPILGGLLGSTALAEGDVATNLTLGMLGFGLALALPFALFALFPSWLSRLPQSGGWMETVKVVLGFLELGLALKFLSNADLVGHWGILKREVFLALWILLAIGLGGYLLGWFRFGKSRPRTRVGLGRGLGAFLSLVFAAYLGYGLVSGSPLKLLSGFPPPDFYTLKESPTDCPLGLDCYKEFDAGLEQARQTGKPILLDFTGWACVNCRKMEEQVWSNPEVFRLLDEEYILISLYVDDREELPESEQFVFRFDSGRTKRIRTVGDRWSAFQTANFGAVSQPYYVQLSPDLHILNPAIQNTDTRTYRDWLVSGLRAQEQVAGAP
ncbi:protein-disulfide reductase DsbD family protein [Robiginitalea biformata]|uniref:Thiol:disulfide interchange protein dsbD, putative n=1 Tax=Robiginitalea biformata (strain ATCC BAA-864 / DSM 15991 / KCTC 12146 / HTCC2501) TaxID=313596 RepID=A4CKW6_ROBBH|nr:thioredoxin family protein [Robiginitalea biformata]EAR15515.1 thiol:disulfide interchange protein dsbD, putative [Robiginitalea biformata HTCC2501]